MTEKFICELDQLHADRDVMAFVGGAYSHETTLERIQESEIHWVTHNFWLMVLV